jgi:alanine dehydrogenase
MPGAVPRTSTFALANATFPGLMEIANKGVVKAVKENYSMRMGLNTAEGKITHQKVAESLQAPWTFPKLWT